MTITLIVIVAILALFLGWIVSHTINVQPWVPVPDGSNGQEQRLPGAFTRSRVGLMVFLAAITSLFALTISAYSGRMHMGSEHMGSDWVSAPLPAILWLNTLMLILASLALHIGWRALVMGIPGRARIGLVIAGLAGILFMAGQMIGWYQLHADGHAVASNPASSFFYFVTALHGVHVIGGLVAWARAVFRVFSGTDLDRCRVTVELCTLYWHYLLVIWIVMFALLLMT
ncbi:MAG: cytochrome c oxidase subunit 3 [Wenzhouxiangellaceae bacterium]